MAPPERFEAGSQPVAQIAAWSEALRYLSTLGMDRVEAHEHTLTSVMLDGISSIDGIQVLGPDSDVDRIGVVAFAVDGVHPHDVGQFMDSVDVAVRVGHHCAIPAPYVLPGALFRACVGCTDYHRPGNRTSRRRPIEVRSFFGDRIVTSTGIIWKGCHGKS